MMPTQSETLEALRSRYEVESEEEGILHLVNGERIVVEPDGRWILFTPSTCPPESEQDLEPKNDEHVANPMLSGKP